MCQKQVVIREFIMENNVLHVDIQKGSSANWKEIFSRRLSSRRTTLLGRLCLGSELALYRVMSGAPPTHQFRTGLSRLRWCILRVTVMIVLSERATTKLKTIRIIFTSPFGINWVLFLLVRKPFSGAINVVDASFNCIWASGPQKLYHFCCPTMLTVTESCIPPLENYSNGNNKSQ